MQVANQIFIIGIVFMAASGAVDKLTGDFNQLLIIGLITTIFHLILLGFTFYSAKIFRIGKGRYESIVKKYCTTYFTLLASNVKIIRYYR